MSIILYPRLPDFFVTPDLGPKMYNAYGKYVLHKTGKQWDDLLKFIEIIFT